MLESRAIEPMNIFKLGKSKNDDEYGRIWVNTKGLGKTLGKIMKPSIFLNDSDIFTIEESYVRYKMFCQKIIQTRKRKKKLSIYTKKKHVSTIII